VNGDNVTVLDPQIVPHDTVDAGASVIQVIISKHNQNGILPLLALHQDCVTTEKLERLHGIVRKGNN
jgi:hypothetical protein